MAPAEFVAARAGRERAARADGDRALAGAVKGLGKPSVAAWLANQLSRTEAVLDPLWRVGAALREATATGDPDALRRLSRERSGVVTGLLATARRLATDADVAVSAATAQAVEQTLLAATADPEAAAALAAGRLTAPLVHAGFPVGAPVSSAGALRPAAEPGAAAPDPAVRDPAAREARQREEAQQREAREREEATQAAAAAVVAATERLTAAEAALAETERVVRRRRSELAEAEREQAAAARAHRDAAAAREAAQVAAERARAKVEPPTRGR